MVSHVDDVVAEECEWLEIGAVEFRNHGAGIGVDIEEILVDALGLSMAKSPAERSGRFAGGGVLVGEHADAGKCVPALEDDIFLWLALGPNNPQMIVASKVERALQHACRAEHQREQFCPQRNGGARGRDTPGGHRHQRRDCQKDAERIQQEQDRDDADTAGGSAGEVGGVELADGER